ncbi:MAG: peptidoglycan-binding protein [Acidimicrobiia bacterium]|nr:peptidoglycan-binding protein [Acidimicrobiia bacterium]
MSRTRRVVTRAAPIAVSLVVMGLGTPAVLANHQAPFDGSTHAYGEMVEYPLTFPVNGPATFTDSFYSARSGGHHHAQDLMSPKMVPVVAAASATVRYVNFSRNPNDLRPDRCCSLVLDHDDGWASWYIHLNNDAPGTDDGRGWGIAPGILPGVHVEAGQLIGWVGDSGNAEATSPHLHFELYDTEGVLVNPFAALRAAQTACTADCYPYNNLAYGSRGAAVMELQSTLAAAGFPPGPIDGIFGSKTRTAVSAFQTAAGLSATGVLDRTTWEALKAAPAPIAVVVETTTTTTAAGTGDVATTTTMASPTTTIAASQTILAVTGNRGGVVFELQRKLLAAGYSPGVVDGIFGRKTEAATKAFQSAKGLAVSGVVDQATWDSLGGPPLVADPADVIIAYRTRGAAVFDLQRRLAQAGYSPGPIDGAFGPKTRAAVTAFQQAKGLDASGVVNGATWQALGG